MVLSPDSGTIGKVAKVTDQALGWLFDYTGGRQTVQKVAGQLSIYTIALQVDETCSGINIDPSSILPSNLAAALQVQSLSDIYDQIKLENMSPAPIITLYNDTTINVTSSTLNISSFIPANSYGNFTIVKDAKNPNSDFYVFQWWHAVIPAVVFCLLVVATGLAIHQCRRSQKIKEEQLRQLQQEIQNSQIGGLEFSYQDTNKIPVMAKEFDT